MWRFFRLLIRPACGFAIFGIDDMAFATMAAGALNFGGNILGGMMGSSGAESSNALQYQMFREQMDFQREVMNNRVQWQANDMQKAGFNRILAVNSAAPMAMGSSPTMMANPGESMQRGVSSASDAASKILLELGKGQIEKGRAEAASAKAQASIDQQTIDAKVGATKAAATVAAANSAQRLNVMKSEQSPIGKWLTGWKTWFGKDKN